MMTTGAWRALREGGARPSSGAFAGEGGVSFACATPGKSDARDVGEVDGCCERGSVVGVRGEERLID